MKQKKRDELKGEDMTEGLIEDEELKEEENLDRSVSGNAINNDKPTASVISAMEYNNSEDGEGETKVLSDSGSIIISEGDHFKAPELSQSQQKQLYKKKTQLAKSLSNVRSKIVWSAIKANNLV